MRNSSMEKKCTKLAVKTSTLMELLDCGRPAAIRIGSAANAKIIIGRKILWNVSAVRKYLDNISEQ